MLHVTLHGSVVPKEGGHTQHMPGLLKSVCRKGWVVERMHAAVLSCSGSTEHWITELQTGTPLDSMAVRGVADVVRLLIGNLFAGEVFAC